MPCYTLRRSLLALALVMPLSAAHPTETAPPAPSTSGFASAFEAFGQVPEVTAKPVAGAVDIAMIEHTQPSDAEADAEAGRMLGSGGASYYAARFDGRRTASGETFDNDALTGAHRTLPFGSKVRVTNTANGRSVVVRINDRGPFHGSRIIDLSKAAASELGFRNRGTTSVCISQL